MNCGDQEVLEENIGMLLRGHSGDILMKKVTVF